MLAEGRQRSNALETACPFARLAAAVSLKQITNLISMRGKSYEASAEKASTLGGLGNWSLRLQRERAILITL